LKKFQILPKKKKVTVQPLEIKKRPEQQKSADRILLDSNTYINTFVSNKTAAMHSEEDIKQCF
jgi:hypothetical protein